MQCMIYVLCTVVRTYNVAFYITSTNVLSCYSEQVYYDKNLIDFTQLGFHTKLYIASINDNIHRTQWTYIIDSNICSVLCVSVIVNNKQTEESTTDKNWIHHCMTLTSPPPHLNAIPWWLHLMERLSVSLALCEGNPSVTGGFSPQRARGPEHYVFFDVSLNKRMNKPWS